MNRDPYDLAVIHPVMKPGVFALAQACFANPVTLEDGRQCFLAPFEGYRHPMRQNHLFTKTKSTKARPWESAHQYGLAVDFAGRIIRDGKVIPNSWTWEVPEELWVQLKRLAAVHGLDVPIAWDRGHVVHPLWNKLRGIVIPAIR